MAPYVPKLPPLDPCPVEHVFLLVGGKWKVRLLYRLSLGDASMGELQRHLPRVRPQVLAAQLSQMQQHGLVQRLAPLPGRLWGDFAITERGRSLREALASVVLWGSEDIGGWTAPVLDAA